MNMLTSPSIPFDKTYFTSNENTPVRIVSDCMMSSVAILKVSASEHPLHKKIIAENCCLIGVENTSVFKTTMHAFFNL